MTANKEILIEKLELIKTSATPNKFVIEEEKKKSVHSEVKSSSKRKLPEVDKGTPVRDVKIKLDFSVKEVGDIFSEDASGKLKTINIEDFSVIKQIGEGSFGQIYLVECNKTLRRLAMKKMIAHKKRELRNFKQEFELMHTIQHENILKIHGLCERVLDKTTYALYIVMEPAISDWDNEIRNRQLKRKPYSEEELIHIIKQIIEGLAFLQYNKISHRDIKPQNVLVFENNIYKMADFGEAKEMNFAKELSTLRGTELYMSPILFENYKLKLNDATHNAYKSDVFSLGYCFVYAATLTFNSLYDIRDLTEMKSIAAILNKYLKNRYTSKIINLVTKMIDIDESKRLDFIELEDYINQNLS
jgi:NIMA (never in mitosis gene a)-related kinase